MLNATHDIQNTFAYTPEELTRAREAFEQAYPEYQQTKHLDLLRTTDYSRLDDTGQTYLDYTGGGLYGASQLTKHMSILSNSVLGNPHSTNPSSMAMTKMDEHARHYVLKYFNADPEEYTVIFTPNASGALKLVGESYPFRKGAKYLITYDNHNSVNGIREFAFSRGADITFIPLVKPELRVDETILMPELDNIGAEGGLFAYPAQSNFSGVQHPLEWVEIAREKGWDVLVDCAAYAPTNHIDLRTFKPDFMTLSFYKIFGYPTGVGALVVRREKLEKLQRPWYAGGTISYSTIRGGEKHYLTPGESGFEDGTINYLTLPAVEIGLKHIEAVSIDSIHNRVMSLTGWLIDALKSLEHSNGRKLVEIYGPNHTRKRGGTVAFNVYDVDGVLHDCTLVEREANKLYISLRAGCHCNPGARETALDLSADDMSALFVNKDAVSYEQFMEQAMQRMEGVVRASMGIASNFTDVFHLVQFIKTFIDQPASAYDTYDNSENCK